MISFDCQMRTMAAMLALPGSVAAASAREENVAQF
jgi:hypothetical protein